MDELTSESLSPASVEPTATELPFGLRWRDLGRATGTAFTSHARQGHPAAIGSHDAEILTLHDGRTVFVKRHDEPPRFEEPRYRFLAAHGIPTPQLIAAVQRDGTEILVLEFLPRIGIDFASKLEVSTLLQSAARWNSITEEPSTFSAPPGFPQDVFDERVRSALSEIGRESWFEIYQSLRNALDPYPVAPCHNEFFFQQVGWSGDRLVVFDLETMSLNSRFMDVTSILWTLAQRTNRDQLDVLAEYLSYTDLDVDLDDAFREVRLVRVRDAWLVLAFAPLTDHSGVGVVLTVVAAAQFLHCLAMGIEDTNDISYRQSVTPDGIQGRMNSTIRTTNRIVFFFGALLTGMLITRLGYHLTIGIGASIFLIAALVIVFSPLRDARHEDAMT